jgi:hypothetical protein
MVKRRIAMSEIPDDIWKAAEAAAKLIITAEELEVNSYQVYDAATVIANAILAERQKWLKALTTNAETKLAYKGEFAFEEQTFDENGNEGPERIWVPWETIEAIMAAIRRRADATSSSGIQSPDPKERLSRDRDIILEAINAYDEYMLDDDFDAQPVLDRIIKRMRERLD